MAKEVCIFWCTPCKTRHGGECAPLVNPCAEVAWEPGMPKVGTIWAFEYLVGGKWVRNHYNYNCDPCRVERLLGSMTSSTTPSVSGVSTGAFGAHSPAWGKPQGVQWNE